MQIMRLTGGLMIVQCINMICIVGIMRSGGDTLFSACLDTGTVWLIGVPLAFMGVYLGFPLWGVCAMICCDELVKSFISIPRVLSGKWVNNIVSRFQSHDAETETDEAAAE